MDSSAARATMRGGDAGTGAETVRGGDGKFSAGDGAELTTDGAVNFVSGGTAGAIRAAVAVAVLDAGDAGWDVETARGAFKAAQDRAWGNRPYGAHA